MNVGMLWFDNDQKTDMAAKILTAADYYQKKYGCRPDLCFVHPTMMLGEGARPAGIEVKTNRIIQPNHFWIGHNA